MSDEFDVLMDAKPLILPAPPADFGEVVTIALNQLKDGIVMGTIEQLLLTFCGTEVRGWLFQGKPPGTMDEILRHLADRTQCDALAWVHTHPVPEGIPADRTVSVAIEARDGALDFLFALTGVHGEPGATFQIFEAPTPPKRRWWGQKSKLKVELVRKGAGFGAPITGEA